MPASATTTLRGMRSETYPIATLETIAPTSVNTPASDVPAEASFTLSTSLKKKRTNVPRSASPKFVQKRDVKTSEKLRQSDTWTCSASTYGPSGTHRTVSEP